MSTLAILLSLQYTSCFSSSLFFFNDTATTEIYTLSLHDLFRSHCRVRLSGSVDVDRAVHRDSYVMNRTSCDARCGDRKSTRLNSSHVEISYAVFCLKKKKIRSCLSSDTDTVSVSGVRVGDSRCH